MKAVFCSGGFDCAHSGHLAYLREAAKLGHVMVLLNSDEWLIRKKGYALLDWDTRADVLKEFECVYAVYEVDDSDGTVCAGLRKFAHLFPGAVFAKGGDRTAENTPEQDVCKQLGIEVVFGVGGGKVASSSELVSNVSGIALAAGLAGMNLEGTYLVSAGTVENLPSRETLDDDREYAYYSDEVG